jgi:DNA-binding transcriptional ArsR family regulator
MVKMFRAIANESRLKILLLLIEIGSKHVSEIAEELDLSVSNVSHHMSKLDDLGFVRRERHGKEVYYYLKDACIIDIIERAIRHVNSE